jgi:ribosomal protein L11 methylase PrmA
MNVTPEKSSFRDRDGFVFYSGGRVYRAISQSYAETWRKLCGTKFFNELIAAKKLVSFTDDDRSLPGVFKVIAPQQIPFISYACEWTFGQLRAAALLTLEIQQKAMKEGFTLKDASSFNVQFAGPDPIFIDLLSFETYNDGEPWKAYGQFCRHFLGPLLLEMHGYGDERLLLSRSHDGIPLQTCSKLLPWRTRMNFTAAIHIHLHARMEKQHGGRSPGSKLKTTSARTAAFLTQLRDAVKNMTIRPEASTWSGYYGTFSYSEQAFKEKKAFVEKHLAGRGYGLCADLGANTGEFSFLAAAHCGQVVACDYDRQVVSRIAAAKTRNVLPLSVDLANPTPSFGWNSDERMSFGGRLKKADVVLALALVHHLCLSNHVPLSVLAAFFAAMEADLVIEFVPADDTQSQRLLASATGRFPDYTEENFRKSFGEHFSFADEQKLSGCQRVIFKLNHK